MSKLDKSYRFKASMGFNITITGGNSEDSELISYLFLSLSISNIDKHKKHDPKHKLITAI